MTRGSQSRISGPVPPPPCILVHRLAILACHLVALATARANDALSGSRPDLAQPCRQGVGRGRGLLHNELVAGPRHLDKPAQG